MRALKVAFVMEQHLGHRTFFENLRGCMSKEPSIDASWIVVDYSMRAGPFEWMPLPHSLRAVVRGQMQIRRQLQVARPEVMFFNTHVAAVLADASHTSTPYLISTDITPTQNGALGASFGQSRVRLPLVSHLRHRQNRLTLQGAQKLLPWSNWAAQSLQHDFGIPTDRVEVLPPGVHVETWTPVDRSHRAAAPVRILFVGGDFVRKGGPVLLEAFRQLPSGSAELHLVTRERIAEQDGVFTYNNLRPNEQGLMNLFHQADVFVLPSMVEPFGIAALEAGAAALPSVVTAVGGLQDIVVDGVTGWIVQPTSVSELAAKLHVAVTNRELRLQMGEAARRRIVSRFSAQGAAVRIAQLLHDVAEQSPRRVRLS